jgi:PAS domain S-box-containing protein
MNSSHLPPDWQLAAIVASSTDAIVSLDLQGVVQSWNGAAERMLGYSAAEMIGRSITVIIPPERVGEEQDVLRRIRLGEIVEHFETVRRRKDGTLLDISLTVSPIRDSAGTIVGASKIARDVTEHRRLLRELERVSRVKDTFLATVSHELRTPLNTVVGYASMLKRDGLSSDELRHKAVAVIHRNAQILTTLVDDLLDMSQIASGEFRIAATPCDLAVIARQAIDSARPIMAAKGLTLRASLAETAPLVADAGRIAQVLRSLLNNASKFTPAGGAVDVELSNGEREVTLVVRDSGIGIAADELPNVFQRFWQRETEATREHGGVGLGLALTRHVVELHGGWIAVRSNGAGQGAEFRVDLPRQGVVARWHGRGGPGATAAFAARPSSSWIPG